MLNTIKLIFTACLVLAFFTGCTNITNQKQSGFLKSYDGFVDSTKYDYTKTYHAKGFGRETMSKLKEIKLIPFEIWIKPSDNPKFNAQQLLALSAYFHESMKTKLEYNNFTIVEKISADTLTIRGAFSGVKLTEPELEITDFVPFRIMTNAGNAVYLQVSNQKDVITKVSVELEFLQGEKQKRVFALIASKYIDATVANNGDDNIKSVQALLDIWANNFVEKIVAVRNTP
ncbi:MAG: DUF3313 domain-containing protein [Colwellia sp.]